MVRIALVAARTLVHGVALSSFLATPLAAVASATPAPSASDADAAPVKATNGGTVSGTVTKVDYQKDLVSVQTAKGVVDVTVLPSTTIQGKGGFDEISDVVKGQHVTVFLSRKGEQNFAQIIQLQK